MSDTAFAVAAFVVVGVALAWTLVCVLFLFVEAHNHKRAAGLEREAHRSFLEAARVNAEQSGRLELVQRIDMEAAAHRLELRHLRPGRARDYN